MDAAAGDVDFPLRWRAIEALFARCVPPAEDRRAALVRKREAGVWQRRYREHTIRDDRDGAAHMDYIHFSPVKHGLAARPADWPFSSFARGVALACIRWSGRPRVLDWPTPASGCDTNGRIS